MANLNNQTITPLEAGRLIGRGQMFVEHALRTKQFPVGKAIKTEVGGWAYIIPKAAFLKWLNGCISTRKRTSNFKEIKASRKKQF